MNRDTFIEILVERKASASMKILKFTLYVLTAIFVVGALLFGMISLLLAILCGIGAYFAGLRSEVEYEYSYMNKEMDVDIIYSKQKRKHLATYDLTKMEILAPINSYHLDDFKNRTVKTIDYSSGKEKQPEVRYVMYYDGNQKLILEPTSELVEAIAFWAPRKVVKS